MPKWLRILPCLFIVRLFYKWLKMITLEGDDERAKQLKQYVIGFVSGYRFNERDPTTNSMPSLSVDRLQQIVVDAMELYCDLGYITEKEKLALGLMVVLDGEFLDIYCSDEEQKKFRESSPWRVSPVTH